MLAWSSFLSLSFLVSLTYCRVTEIYDARDFEVRTDAARYSENGENTAEWRTQDHTENYESRVDLDPRTGSADSRENTVAWIPEEEFGPRDDVTGMPPVVEPIRCGQVPLAEMPEEKVINGSVSTRNFYPFMVEFKFTWYHVCGGAIYDKYHVITAAHCIKKDTKLDDITLVFADWDNLSEDKGQYPRKVAEVIKHPIGQRSSYMKNDIAILRLEEPLEFNDKVQPICMPSAKVTGGEPTVVMGWGYTYATNDKRFLIEAEVPIVSKEKCTRSGWYGDAIKPGMICAGYRKGQIDSCQGDSGGPLVQKVGEAYELTGLVSWGPTKCASPKKPGVYTDVWHYRDWIKQVAGEPQY